MDANERRIVQEIKTIANLEHRYNPYNSSWGLVLEYCKQLLEGEKTMSNQEYLDTFDEVRGGYKKLHTMPLDKLRIMYVGGVGKREVTAVLSCEDFNDITTKGSVVVTEKHGAFLKVTDQHWVKVNRFEAEGILHDADVLLALILEQDHINVLIEPGHEA